MVRRNDELFAYKIKTCDIQGNIKQWRCKCKVVVGA